MEESWSQLRQGNPLIRSSIEFDQCAHLWKAPVNLNIPVGKAKPILAAAVRENV